MIFLALHPPIALYLSRDFRGFRGDLSIHPRHVLFLAPSVNVELEFAAKSEQVSESLLMIQDQTLGTKCPGIRTSGG